MDIPKEFFTLQSMLTLTGATGAVFVVSNGIQSAFNINPRWLALLIAQCLALIGIYITEGAGIDYFVGVVNGFLIYCTAIGATAVGGGNGGGPIARDIGVGTPGDAPLPRRGATRRRFLTPWF